MKEELYESLKGLLDVVQGAIASGDWAVDGACDPDMEIIRAIRAITEYETAYTNLYDIEENPEESI